MGSAQQKILLKVLPEVFFSKESKSTCLAQKPLERLEYFTNIFRDAFLVKASLVRLIYEVLFLLT